MATTAQQGKVNEFIFEWEGRDRNGRQVRGESRAAGENQVMPISDEIQQIILRDGNAVEIARQSELEGVKSLRQSGLEKVKLGVTSLEEVLSCTNV